MRFQIVLFNDFDLWYCLNFCWGVFSRFSRSWITVSSLAFSWQFSLGFLSYALLPALDFRCDRNWRVWWNIDWQMDINFTNHLRLSENESFSSFYHKSNWIEKLTHLLTWNWIFLLLVASEWVSNQLKMCFHYY